MIRNLFLLVALVALGIFVIPQASATSVPPVFDLNVDYCGNSCLGGVGNVGGTVTLSQVGNTVTVDVVLNSPLQFHDAGLDSFSFNINGFPSGVTFAILIGPGWTQNTMLNADGAGNFMYSFECVKGSNACSPSGQTEFKFTATATGLTLADFEYLNGGQSNVDFAANVAVTGTSGCTGVIGGGSGTTESTPAAPGSTGGNGTVCSSTPVPEPTSILLFGTVLAFAGRFLKRRVAGV